MYFPRFEDISGYSPSGTTFASREHLFLIGIKLNCGTPTRIANGRSNFLLAALNFTQTSVLSSSNRAIVSCHRDLEINYRVLTKSLENSFPNLRKNDLRFQESQLAPLCRSGHP